jgi:hypothetical protein
VHLQAASSHGGVQEQPHAALKSPVSVRMALARGCASVAHWGVAPRAASGVTLVGLTMRGAVLCAVHDAHQFADHLPLWGTAEH